MGYNREFEIDEQQAKDFLEYATSRVKTQEDIDTLDALSKLFKRNVPLTIRKYVVAYLLKEALKHNHSFTSNRKSEKTFKNEKNNKHQRTAEKTFASKPTATVEQPAEERPHHERVVINPEDATSIFVSIGRNRRVYPRDLVGLLIGVAGLDRERIGDIKVLANYSFVQLYTADTAQAIEKLNGYEYRGRKLTVSFSKQKSDEDAADEIPTDETVDSENMAAQNQMEEMSAEDAAAYAAAEKAAADKEPFGMN